jgi:hypothetical protein
MAAKSFPQKLVRRQICLRKMFGRKFFMVAISFPAKPV